MRTNSTARRMPGTVLLVLALALFPAVAATAQQIVREQLLLRPGASLAPATVAAAPGGGFVLAGGAFRLPSGTGFSHLYVTRLDAVGDTLWQRFLPQGPTPSSIESVRTDLGGIWLFNTDTLQSLTNPNVANLGTRLWRLSSAGRLRQVVRPAYRLPGEFAQCLLPGPGGDLYALAYNQRGFSSLTAPSILRLDSTGTLRWRRDYAFCANNSGASLCYTPRGTVLLAGQAAVGTSTSFRTRARLLEVETSRGDSVGGAALPLAPGTSDEQMFAFNGTPYEAIALRQGGYAVPSVAVPANTLLNHTGELTRLDATYDVVWRYFIPAVAVGARQFTQVRELADGTLLALAHDFSTFTGRTFWLYRFDGATGTLLAVYPFTSAFTGQRRVVAAHLLPVAADSTLLVVGHNADFNHQGVYIARLRVPNLPRVVTSTAPGRAVAGGPGLGVPYPNPASGEVRVSYRLPGPVAAQLELRDVLGRLVHKQALPMPSGEAQLSVGHLASGVYICTLVANGRVLAARRVSVQP